MDTGTVNSNLVRGRRERMWRMVVIEQWFSSAAMVAACGRRANLMRPPREI